MRIVHRVLYAIVFLSLARTTVPGLAEAVREALTLRDMTRAEKRVKMFGPFYESLLAIAPKALGEPVALMTGLDPGPALFANYYLYPARTRFYGNSTLYRIDPRRPARVVHIDGEAQLLTYAEYRAVEMGTAHIVKELTLPDETRLSFFVPLASSGDGYPPDRWTTEGVMQNAGDGEARVTIDFPPARRRITLTLQPGETRAWTDIIYQLFGVLDQGWLEVESDQPLRARFWFVNRATGDADEVPFAKLGRRFEFPHHPGSRIWLVNPHDRALPLRVNGGGDHGVPPMNIVPLEWIGDIRIEADSDFYAYQSWRTETCCTGFRWPEHDR